MTNETISIATEVIEQAMQWPEACMWIGVAIGGGLALFALFKYQ